MILSEIVEEVFEGLGNPSDLEYRDPITNLIDTTSDGWLKMVRAINDGALALSTWKLPNGRQVKLRLNEENASVITASEEQLVVSVTGRYVTFSDAVETGMLAIGQTSGAVGIIAYAADDLGTMVKQTGTFTVGETVNLYSRDFSFPTDMITKKPIDILQVTDSEGTPILETTREDGLIVATTTPGIPTLWRRMRQALRFDLYPQDDLEYFIRYARGPEVLVAAGDEPELPPQLHRGLVLYGQWWGLRRAQESGDAYSVKRDLDDFMARTRIEDDFIISGQVKAYPDGK